MQGVIQSSVSENPRPKDFGWLNNNRPSQTCQGESEKNSSQSDDDFESPSSFDTVEVPLLRQHIGTKPGEETQICHDEDKNIFLGMVSHIRLLKITVDSLYD